MFQVIVFGTDGSETADIALPLVKRLGAAGARIVVVHANEIMVGRGGPSTRYANEDELHAKVQQQTRELTQDGVDATLRVVTGVQADPAHAIVGVAGDEGADLIVVGTRGHSRIAGLLVGSVTQRLLHIAPCPVMAVPSVPSDLFAPAESVTTSATSDVP